ncbi:unnamed protein product [Spirodela intermedia]|uniref:Uncharacterized protein n=1 Tax=Spirodela intermedia TaxID=51605 RepID=A0A7I8LN41_SPIIN|nr:unnamed protein product [Spirodela intermedia]
MLLVGHIWHFNQAHQFLVSYAKKPCFEWEKNRRKKIQHQH